MLPVKIGNTDFINTNDAYYVDKTLIIKEIIDSVLSSILLITRPRRFGKSLTMSMIDYYFNSKGDYSYLFKDKNIAKEDKYYYSFLNQYPVVHINMKSIFVNQYSSIKDNVSDLVSTLYREYAYLLDSENLLPIDKQEINLLINREADYKLLSKSISRLTYYLQKHFSKKVILLIDEYDTPVQSAYKNGQYNETISFLKEFYGEALKDNSNLFFAIVTGVVEISKESLFSGLNNLLVCPINEKRFSSYFGFNQKEVEEIISYYHLPITFEELRSNYGGYNLVNGEELCNPWSIMNYVYFQNIKPYWANTGTNRLVGELISDSIQKDRLLRLINNEEEYDYFNSNFTYQDLDKSTFLLSYLAELGYLGLKPVDKGNQYIYFIPNLEINMIFENEILDHLKIWDINIYNTFKQDLLNGNGELFTSILEKNILSSLSTFNFKDENIYQNVLTGALSILSTIYVVENEVNSGTGRCDIMLYPKRRDIPGIIIELKKSRARKKLTKLQLEKLAKEALLQIKNQDYIEKLRLKNIDDIFICGIAFWEKNSLSVFEKIES